jgi:hypothetical protein
MLMTLMVMTNTPAKATIKQQQRRHITEKYGSHISLKHMLRHANIRDSFTITLTV